MRPTPVHTQGPVTPADTPLRVGVLGPLQVLVAGEERTPTAPMVRRVLAVLLLHANRPVTVSSLIQELWEDEPPRLARKTIQTYVYQLRKALQCPQDTQDDDRLETRTNGYLLRLNPDELDLWQFERQVGQARTALGNGNADSALTMLRTALGTWRGDALIDIEAGPLLAARIPQIEDSRLSALELRIEAELRLGQHRPLLGELRRLTADHPLNEEFTAQLMLATHRAGQRSAALDAYTRLRRNLVEELGIEPSERLRKLQQAVLEESRALDLQPMPRTPGVPEQPSARIAQLPADTPDFTGRHRELERLDTLVGSGDDPTAGMTPRVAVVLGGPGSGKSALAVRAAHRLTGRFPDGQFYARLHDDHDTPVNPALILRSFLEDMGTEPDPTCIEPLAACASDELARRFRSRTADRAFLFLLDDAAGAAQILPLLPGGRHSTLIVTSRVRLPGLPGTTHLTPGPLTAEDGTVLLSSVAGPTRFAADPGAARRIVRLMAHLPLGIRAAGERLMARPMWSATDFADRLAEEQHRRIELSTGACDVLAQMEQACKRLPEAAHQALVRLSQARLDAFDLTQAAQLLSTDTRTAESLLGDLLDHHVLGLADTPDEASPSFRIPQLIGLALLAHPASNAELHLLPGGRPKHLDSRAKPFPATG